MPPTKPVTWITARTDAEYYRAIATRDEMAQYGVRVIVEDHRRLKRSAPPEKKAEG